MATSRLAGRRATAAAAVTEPRAAPRPARERLHGHERLHGPGHGRAATAAAGGTTPIAGAAGKAGSGGTGAGVGTGGSAQGGTPSAGSAGSASGGATSVDPFGCTNYCSLFTQGPCPSGLSNDECMSSCVSELRSQTAQCQATASSLLSCLTTVYKNSKSCNQVDALSFAKCSTLAQAYQGCVNVPPPPPDPPPAPPPPPLGCATASSNSGRMCTHRHEVQERHLLLGVLLRIRASTSPPVRAKPATLMVPQAARASA